MKVRPFTPSVKCRLTDLEARVKSLEAELARCVEFDVLQLRINEARLPRTDVSHVMSSGSMLGPEAPYDDPARQLAARKARP